MHTSSLFSVPCPRIVFNLLDPLTFNFFSCFLHFCIPAKQFDESGFTFVNFKKPTLCVSLSLCLSFLYHLQLLSLRGGGGGGSASSKPCLEFTACIGLHRFFLNKAFWSKDARYRNHATIAPFQVTFLSIIVTESLFLLSTRLYESYEWFLPYSLSLPSHNHTISWFSG